MRRLLTTSCILAVTLWKFDALAQTAAGTPVSLRDGNLHVVLCGTGSPLPDPARASACTAILAGSEFVLIDIGPGSWRKADLAQLPLGELTAILLTHFHSDHIGDLGEAITMSWAGGRTKPLEVYGPEGVEAVVQGFLTAYQPDAGYRTAHHGEANMPIAASRALPKAIAPDQEVFNRNGLRITAFPVHHEPISPAYGYRIEYKGRIVVISGDTVKSQAVEKNAEGADLLLHDSLSKTMILAAAGMADAAGQKRRAAMARDIVTYHTTPVEAAETAAAAHVATLVLTHVVPSLRNDAQEKQFLTGTAEVFSGKIVIARDGMRFDLPAK